MSPQREDTPTTNPAVPKLRALQPSYSGMAPKGSAVDQAKPQSIEEQLGAVMAATATNTQVCEALAVAVGSLTGKLDGYIEASEGRKKEIKEATTKAATHGSNRLALLMGAFLTLYEIASPMLHELAKWVQK